MTIKIISDGLQMGHEALETYYQLFTIKYIEIIYKFIRCCMIFRFESVVLKCIRQNCAVLESTLSSLYTSGDFFLNLNWKSFFKDASFVSFYPYTLSQITSNLSHEKLIFCFSGTAAFVFRHPLQIFYPRMVSICLSNRSCFRYRGITKNFKSSAYLLQVWLN